MRPLKFCVALLLIAGCASTPSVERMSLDEKVGQMFVYAAHANYINEGSPAWKEMQRQVRENKVGGVIWFVSDVYDTAFLTGRLQREAKIPLLVSADLEAGSGMRFSHTTYWPHAMAVAATGDPSLAEQQGKLTARETGRLGINHILAPVADVNVAPENPVINTRSYGEDPVEVGKFVSAFIRGVQSERVLATAKHFPGHGDTRLDSHRSLPILDVDRARLDAVELVPFRAAIDAGVGSVMIGHLAIPSLDPTPIPMRLDHADENPYAKDAEEITRGGTMPASLSAPIIGGLLRRDLGFTGLVVGDAFDMGGLVAHFEPGEAAVRGVLAGEDMMLKSSNLDAAIAAVKAAVREGRIPESRIDESVRRILDAKRRVHAGVATQEEIFREVDPPASRAVAAEIARRAITLLREEEGMLPLQPAKRPLLLVVSDFPEAANPLSGVAGELSRRTKRAVPAFVIDSRSREEDAAQVLEAAKNADYVLLGITVRQSSGGGRIAVPALAKSLLDRITVPVVGVSFGSPYVLGDLPSLRTYVCAYGVQPVLQGAAMRALFGEAPIGGRLPVTIPGLHARGEGMARAARAVAQSESLKVSESIHSLKVSESQSLKGGGVASGARFDRSAKTRFTVSKSQSLKVSKVAESRAALDSTAPRNPNE